MARHGRPPQSTPALQDARTAPDMLSGRDLPLIALLRQLAALPAITPQLMPGDGQPQYPCNLTQSDIDAIVASGLLVPRFLKRCAVCPQCRSEQFSLSEACVACGSQDLSSVPLGYHYPCAAVFALPAGKRQRRHCPKCGDRLAERADEFEECGQVYHCAACNHVSPEANTRLHCPSCHWAGDANEAPIVRVEDFRLTEKALALIGEVLR